MVEFLIAAIFFYLASQRIAAGFSQHGSGILQVRERPGPFISMHRWIASCFQPGIGMIAEYCGETLQRHFVFPETDTVTDTQRDFSQADPGIVPVNECTIS